MVDCVTSFFSFHRRCCEIEIVGEGSERDEVKGGKGRKVGIGMVFLFNEGKGEYDG